MSTMFAQLTKIAARAGKAGLEGYAVKRPGEGSKKAKGKAGCTPCEAMARRRRAQQKVRGG